MNSKSRFYLASGLLALSGSASAFVHIHQLKPRLPVSPENSALNFYWNGEAPELTDKEEVLDGAFAEANDRELMEALLNAAVNVWNRVPTAYIELHIDQNPDVELEADDEIFAIVVEEQASKTVAAAASPNFISQDDDPSELEKDVHIIHDCDIAIADTKVKAKSLLRTLVHELGHCLGLGHPHSSYVSIMSYSTFETNSVELALDDEAGVSFLYPAAGESQDVKALTSCGSVGGNSASSASWFCLGLPLALSLLNARRRKK